MQLLSPWPAPSLRTRGDAAGSRPVLPLLSVSHDMNVLASCLGKAARIATSLAFRVRKSEARQSAAVELVTKTFDAPVGCEPRGRSTPVRVPRPVPTATIGPCLTCQCHLVDVNLLTNFVRYCHCPQCGNAWTEPAKSQAVEPESWYFPSEPLKFLRDRN
jgi:hypothetical protein